MNNLPTEHDRCCYFKCTRPPALLVTPIDDAFRTENDFIADETGLPEWMCAYHRDRWNSEGIRLRFKERGEPRVVYPA
jgi:hypothetical protein